MAAEEKKKKKPIGCSIVIIVVVVVFVILLIVANVAKKNEEKGGTTIDPSTSYEEPTETEPSEQDELNAQYGIPPEGYKWNTWGELEVIPVSGIAPEEVCFRFLRAVAQLDFQTAGIYSQTSNIVRQYEDYYSNEVESDDSVLFSRKLFAEIIKSIEVVGVRDESIMEGNKRVITLTVKMLDFDILEDFEIDKTELFAYADLVMKTDAEGINSRTKIQKFMSDMIINNCQKGLIEKEEVIVDFVLEGSVESGFFIIDDSDIFSHCLYQYAGELYSRLMTEYERSREAAAEPIAE
ncbi:MAG: hypothetical protein LBM93_10080 [Oscillospiraceae bacterium]|nr:hypothetical protein [Oscillospiraceae bacterium]